MNSNEAIRCPECAEPVPEIRLAIHLQFCQSVNSTTGDDLALGLPSSSSGFIDDKNSNPDRSLTEDLPIATSSINLQNAA